MRTTVVAAVLACSVGTASGAYLVELRGGDRLTVDSYWEDGERMHLMRGGVDLSVPRSRVHGMREVSVPAEAGVSRAPTDANRAATTQPPGADRPRKELDRQRVRIERHLVRAHMEASEAQARGDVHAAKRLEKEIARTQRRREDVKRAIDAR
jgi:hypothetical protein